MMLLNMELFLQYKVILFCNFSTFCRTSAPELTLTNTLWLQKLANMEDILAQLKEINPLLQGKYTRITVLTAENRKCL
jgi:hypothetical protein